MFTRQYTKQSNNVTRKQGGIKENEKTLVKQKEKDIALIADVFFLEFSLESGF